MTRLAHVVQQGHLWWTIALLLAVWGCASISRPSRLAARAVPLIPLGGPIRTVVVDAGHGGKDPGASSFGLQEKHLTLDIAQHLKAELQRDGLEVVMTRETDRFLALGDRPDVANRLGAGLFVSLHVNANRDRRVSGAEVYYPRDSVVSSTAYWPPSVKSSEVNTSSWAIRHILWDLVLGRTRVHASHLASDVCGALQEDLRVRCQVKPAKFVVLREAQMPAVLVEVGYVSNRDESGQLNRTAYRRAAARAVAKGIVAYIRRLGTQHI